MPAVVTDQFRILNASNFVDSLLDDTNNSYYVFLGLPNPTISSPQGPVGFGRSSDWNVNPVPSPIDNLQYISNYRDTGMFGKKITNANVRRVVKKYSWTKNARYDMYRHDYSILKNPSPNGETNLYNTNYYVMNSDYRVYVCIDNGSSGSDPKGKRSLDEPTFTDLEPTAAGSDGFIWKYLFTISPSDVIKFDSTEYVVLPNNWDTTTDTQIQNIRESGNSDINKNQIKTVYIDNAGSSAKSVYREGSHTVDILGDGKEGKALVTVSSTGVITDVIVVAGGYGYTYGIVDLGTVQLSSTIEAVNLAKLIPIIPPSKGHGYDVYKELGADKVLIYARFDDSTKDFPTDTHFSQVGIIKNPQQYSSDVLYTGSQYNSLSSVKLQDGIDISHPDNLIGVGITQSVNDGVARGYVASYDPETKVLKYFTDRSLHFINADNQTDGPSVTTQSKVLSFESSSNNIVSVNPNAAFEGSVDQTFSGISTIVDSKQINLGVEFTNGLANSEINKKTGDVIYIDNRSVVKRDLRQKEDVKIILEF